MKQDIKNDFDKEIRSILEDAEAEVPQHLMDDIFSRLDDIEGEKRRRAGVPLWLKWATAGMAAAAALTFGVIHWRGDETGSTGTRIDKVASAESSQDDMPEKDTRIAEASESSIHYVSVIAPSQEPIPSDDEEEPVDAEDEKTTITNYYTEDSESESTTRNEVSEIKDNADENIPDSDPFAGLDDEENKTASRLSFAAGGNLLSNGNASGISKFGGSRLPPSGMSDATYIEQTSKDSDYAIPLSFGVSAKIRLAKRWYAGVGVNYTLLQRTFTGTYTKIKDGEVTSIGSDIKHKLHYIGVPVNVYYHILDGSRARLYAYAGGSVEKGISNVYKVKNSPKPISVREKVDGVQWSVGAGLGVEFRLTDELGLYINPGVSYFFDCGQPVSIRTQQPLMMDFEAGFRINL